MSDGFTGYSRGQARVRPGGSAPFPRWAWVAFATLVVLVLVSAATAEEASDSVSADPDTAELLGNITRPAERETLPAVEHPFRPGESLRFSVQYGFIHAGSAYLEVPEVKEWNGHEVYALVARAESNSFFSRFYKVRNRIESYWDRDGLYSWRYAENRREGKSADDAFHDIEFPQFRG